MWLALSGLPQAFTTRHSGRSVEEGQATVELHRTGPRPLLPLLRGCEARSGNRERLDNFLNLYGFCRNICLALLLATVILLVGGTSEPWRNGGVGEHIWWATVAAPVAAIGMFYRYLKFFRDFTIEVYRSYAEVE